MKKIIPVFILFFLTYACENPITFEWEVRISTNTDNYTFPATVNVRIENESRNPVDIRDCNGESYFEIQRLVGVDWNTVYAVECPVENVYSSLGGGDEITFSVDLSMLDDQEDRSGTYRFELIIYPGDERSVRLPESMRVSNEFFVTE